MAPTFIPTKDQKKAAELIEKFLTNSKEKFFLLTGYAGVGKSSIINHILQSHFNQGKSIAVSSFTNKATSVISGMTPFATGISLFRLLGLKTEEESEQLIFEFKGKDKLKKFDIIVIDEISMLSDECYDLLVEKVQRKRGVKIILMGDPAQLPPVNDKNKDSKAFNIENYTPSTHYELTEIVRQSKQSNIPKYSFYVRNVLDKINSGIEIPISLELPHARANSNLANNNDNFLRDSNTSECKEHTQVKENAAELVQSKTQIAVQNPDDIILLNDSQKFIDLVLEYFSKDEYKKNSDYAKVIAYRNIVIDNMNKRIRNKLFFSTKETTALHKDKVFNPPSINPTQAGPGPNNSIVCQNLQKISSDLAAIMLGENLILTAPAYDLNGDSSYSVYDTSDEITVETIIDYSFLKRTILDVEFNFPYFLIKARRKYDNKPATLKVINPAYKIRFEDLLGVCSKKISALTNKDEAKKLFKNHFYALKKEVCNVSYGYAVTAHRAQGSTYSVVFVIEDDLDHITKASVKSLWQAKYVVASRAAEKLVILNRIKDRKKYEEFFCE